MQRTGGECSALQRLCVAEPFAGDYCLKFTLAHLTLARRPGDAFQLATNFAFIVSRITLASGWTAIKDLLALVHRTVVVEDAAVLRQLVSFLQKNMYFLVDEPQLLFQQVPWSNSKVRGREGVHSSTVRCEAWKCQTHGLCTFTRVCGTVSRC